MGNPNPKNNLPNKGKRGRPAGAVSKLPKTVKEAIEKAFNNVGGERYLTELAKKDPKTFASLLSKIIPQQVAHTDNDGNNMPISINVNLVSSDNKEDKDKKEDK